MSRNRQDAEAFVAFELFFGMGSADSVRTGKEDLIETQMAFKADCFT
jgi:hypothetical protein